MKFLSVLVPALLVVSCKIEKKKDHTIVTNETDTSSAPASTAPAFDVNDSTTLVGQKLEVVQPALEAAKIRFRVIEKDGEPMIMTMDYLPERLNFKIKDGVITEVSKG